VSSSRPEQALALAVGVVATDVRACAQLLAGAPAPPWAQRGGAGDLGGALLRARARAASLALAAVLHGLHDRLRGCVSGAGQEGSLLMGPFAIDPPGGFSEAGYCLGEVRVWSAETESFEAFTRSAGAAAAVALAPSEAHRLTIELIYDSQGLRLSL